jgi:hypothetical protein
VSIMYRVEGTAENTDHKAGEPPQTDCGSVTIMS